MYVYKLTVWNVVDVLARSSISRSHCSRFLPCNLGHCSILLAFIFILLFSRTIAVLPLLFSLLGLPCRYLLFQLLSAIFNSIHHFYCRAIFIAAIPFCRCSARQQLSRLFIQGWTFLLLGCHFCSGPVIAIFILLLKDAFFVTTGCRRFFFFFFAFLVVLLVIFSSLFLLSLFN